MVLVMQIRLSIVHVTTEVDGTRQESTSETKIWCSNVKECMKSLVLASVERMHRFRRNEEGKSANPAGFTWKVAVERCICVVYDYELLKCVATHTTCQCR